MRYRVGMKNRGSRGNSTVSHITVEGSDLKKFDKASSFDAAKKMFPDKYVMSVGALYNEGSCN